MRPIIHPNIKDVTVEGILHAFSDPVRIRIFMDLAGGECSKNCSSYLNLRKKPLAKSTLSQHFKILRDDGLIYSERQGVEIINRTRCPELMAKFGEMISGIIKTYAVQEKLKKK
jgi:DNA-binding transcriptional ArsR family regulator